MGIIPSKQTCKNYLALVANENDVSICTSMISKTRTRYTVEIFLILAMTLICVVSATHFDISTEFQRKVENDMKVADEGVSLLYTLLVRRKAEDNQLKLQNLIEDNIECEERILNIMSEKGMED